MADVNSSLPVRTQTNGDVIAQIGDGTLTASIRDLANDALNVAIVDGSGDHITSFGGTSAVDDSAFTVATDSVTPVGYLADETTPDSVDEGDVGLARMTLTRKAYSVIADATNERSAVVLDTGSNDSLAVALVNGSGTQITDFMPDVSKVDDAAFTVATDSVVPVGMLADETTPDSVTEGDVGLPRMTLNRKAYSVIADPTAERSAVVLDTGSNDSLAVAIVDASGNQITSFGGTSAVDDSAFTVATDSVTPVGYLADETTPDSVDEGDVGLARMTLTRKAYSVIADATNERSAVVLDTGSNDSLAVALVNGSGTQITDFMPDISIADDAAFTVATSPVMPAGFLADETTPDSVDEGDIGAARMTLNRKAYSVISDPTAERAAVVLDTGSNDSLAVAIVDGSGTQITSFGGGAEYAEDSAHANLDVGTFILAVRRDTAISTGADGDYVGLLSDSTGHLYCVLGENSGVDIGDVTINNADTDPVPVNIVASNSTTEQNDYNTTSALASSGTANHDTTVTASTTFHVYKVHASASGKIKVEVSTGPVAGLSSQAVGFNSTANPNVDIDFPVPHEVDDASTGTVRVAITNLESSAMDVYSYVNGHEVAD